jgi:hypothetical protein
MSINKWFYLVAFSIAFILLAGCSVGPAGRTEQTGAYPPVTLYPTRTRTPTVTVSLTASEIPTVVPLVTASPGPEPDLELSNITLLNDYDYEFIFMAEMRNNSGETMIFNEREFGIRLYFEQWWEHVGYHHALFEANLRPLSDSVQRMNCILYPGEAGILAFNTWGTCTMEKDCPRKDEISQEPPGQLGTRLTGYQGTPWLWKDLRNLLLLSFHYHYPEQLDQYAHPEAQNLTYRIDGSQIIIEYDTDVNLPSFGDVDVAWLILYGGDGKIINVLYSRDNFCTKKSCLGLDRYHVTGIGSNGRPALEQSATPGVNTTWWRPLFDLTDDQLKQVNSIRVFTELQDWNICENYLE